MIFAQPARLCFDGLACNVLYHRIPKTRVSYSHTLDVRSQILHDDAKASIRRLPRAVENRGNVVDARFIVPFHIFDIFDLGGCEQSAHD